MSIYRLFNGTMVRLLVIACVDLSFTACLNGPAFFKPSSGELKSNSPFAPVEKDEAGVLTATLFTNSTSEQTVAASQNSAIADAGVTFPPGSLAIDTSVTIEEGATVVSDSMAAEIGLAGVGVSAAGNAVVLSSSVPTDAIQPFTVAIPLGNVSLRLLENNPSFLIVLYKVFKAAENRYVVGVIPHSLLTVQDGKVSFATSYFGAYQAAYPDAEIKEAKEVETTAPVLTKAKEKSLTPVVWQSVDATFASSSGNLNVHGTVSGLTSLARCLVFADRDKAPPLDFSASIDGSVDALIAFANVADGTYFVRMACTENNGRVSASDWSAASFAYKKPLPVATDNIGPKVDETIPSANAQQIARTTAITVTFDEPVAPSSVTGGCLGVQDPNGEYISLVQPFSIINDNKTIKVVPGLPLAINATYKVLVQAGCVKDVKGNGTSGFIWKFTTENGGWLASGKDVGALGKIDAVYGAASKRGDLLISFLDRSSTRQASVKGAGQNSWSAPTNIPFGSMGVPGAFKTKTLFYDNGDAELLTFQSSIISTTQSALYLNHYFSSGTPHWGNDSNPPTPVYTNADPTGLVGFDAAIVEKTLIVAYVQMTPSSDMVVLEFAPNATAPTVYNLYDTTLPTPFTANSRVQLRCNKKQECLLAAGDNGQFRSYSRTANGTWGTETKFSYSADNSPLYNAFIDANGNGTLIWVHGTSMKEVHRATLPKNATAWTEQSHVKDFGTNTMGSYDIVQLPNDDIVLGFADSAQILGTTNYSVTPTALTIRSDGTVVASSLMGAYDVLDPYYPSVQKFHLAVNSSGVLAAAWVDRTLVFGAYRSKGATTWTATQLATGDTIDTLDLAIDHAGNATAVWNSQTAGNNALYARRFLNGSTTWQPTGATRFNPGGSFAMGPVINSPFTGTLAVPVLDETTYFRTIMFQ